MLKFDYFWTFIAIHYYQNNFWDRLTEPLAFYFSCLSLPYRFTKCLKVCCAACQAFRWQNLTFSKMSAHSFAGNNGSCFTNRDSLHVYCAKSIILEFSTQTGLTNYLKIISSRFWTNICTCYISNVHVAWRTKYQLQFWSDKRVELLLINPP